MAYLTGNSCRCLQDWGALRRSVDFLNRWDTWELGVEQRGPCSAFISAGLYWKVYRVSAEVGACDEALSPSR